MGYTGSQSPSKIWGGDTEILGVTVERIRLLLRL